MPFRRRALMLNLMVAPPEPQESEPAGESSGPSAGEVLEQALGVIEKIVGPTIR